MNLPAKITVEVCAASLEVAIAAERAGADRIELNTALELDGLTPPDPLVQSVLGSVRIPVICMVRARSGDFAYADSEWQRMLDSAARLAHLGVAGIAFGCVGLDGRVQAQRLAQIRDRVTAINPKCELVFHRAFDQVRDPAEAIDLLSRAGVCRVMTSGAAGTAMEGAPRIGQLVAIAAGRVGVLPASRIDASNAAQLVRQTGVSQIHGTFGTAGMTEMDAIEERIGQVIAAVSE